MSSDRDVGCFARVDTAATTIQTYQLSKIDVKYYHHNNDLTRFNKIAIQGTPQMAVDREAISLSRVY